MVTFLEEQKRQTTLPIATEDVAYYVSYLSLTYKASAIKSVLSAISYKHKIKNMPDPTKSYMIKKLLAGMGKTTVDTQEKFKPLTYKILATLLPKIESVTKDTYEKILFKAVFTLAYTACMRVSEYAVSANDTHTLLAKNVKFMPTTEGQRQTVKVTLETFKHSTSQETLYIVSQEGSIICPVKALKNYLKIRPEAQGPLFIHRDKKPLTRNAVSHILRAAIKMIDLDPAQFTPHSLRIGRATDLAIQNQAEHIIKKTGRWNSDAYVKYIRLHNFYVPLPPMV